MRHRSWAVSTKNICAVEEWRQICKMQIKRDRTAGASAREGRHSCIRLQTLGLIQRWTIFPSFAPAGVGFPSMPSRSLTSLKGVTSFSVNEEKLPMEKRVFGIRSDGMSIWCVFILRELNSTNQSSCSLTIPFVWKPCWSSSFAETLRRARTSTWVPEECEASFGIFFENCFQEECLGTLQRCCGLAILWTHIYSRH